MDVCVIVFSRCCEMTPKPNIMSFIVHGNPLVLGITSRLKVELDELFKYIVCSFTVYVSVSDYIPVDLLPQNKDFSPVPVFRSVNYQVFRPVAKVVTAVL
jgi:hypothetical protein